MSCGLIDSWRGTWAGIWAPLVQNEPTPNDIFGDLISGVGIRPRRPRTPHFPPEAYDELGVLSDVDAVAETEAYKAAVEQYQHDARQYDDALSTDAAKPYFRGLWEAISTETEAVIFLERAYAALDNEFTDRFVTLTERFIDKHNIGYTITPPFRLNPNILGLFGRLKKQTHSVVEANAHYRNLWNAFETAFSEMRQDQSPNKIENCIHRQFLFIEAVANDHPNTTVQQTFGQMSKELDWPHPTLKEIGPKLYGFRSNYPGLGHAGNPASVIRGLEMRDAVGMTLMLFSLMPYLSNDLDNAACYGACA